MNNTAGPACEAFAVQDCALAAIATGRRAYNLRELRDKLSDIDSDSIYYHFWGGLLRPRFDDPEYHNDFAIWSHCALQDAVLAERLGIINPTDFQSIEQLREHVIEVIEERMDEREQVPAADPDNPFYFVRSQIVVFDTSSRITRAEELCHKIPAMSVGSVFYHFIDALRRSEQDKDDFSAWLQGCFGNDYAELCGALREIDPFFSGLRELRNRLTNVFLTYLGG